MRRLLAAERNALLPVLEQDWDDIEDMMRHIVVALDNATAARTTYVGVMQFGDGDSNHVFYVGIGPYSGKVSAAKALAGHPAISEAYRYAVIPLTSPSGLERLLKAVG